MLALQPGVEESKGGALDASGLSHTRTRRRACTMLTCLREALPIVQRAAKECTKLVGKRLLASC